MTQATTIQWNKAIESFGGTKIMITSKCGEWTIFGFGKKTSVQKRYSLQHRNTQYSASSSTGRIEFPTLRSVENLAQRLANREANANTARG